MGSIRGNVVTNGMDGTEFVGTDGKRVNFEIVFGTGMINKIEFMIDALAFIMAREGFGS